MILESVRKIDYFVSQKLLKYYSPAYDALADFLLISLLVIYLSFATSGKDLAMRLLKAIVIWTVNELIIKRLIKRKRPIEWHDMEEKVSNYSFPSTHSLLATYLALHISPLLLPVAFLIAFLRLVGQRHWLSDVIIGMALGFVLYMLGI